MSFSMPQVFISSTSEFAAERKELAQALEDLQDFKLRAYIYEDDAAGPTAPEKQLQAVLENSEIVVLILGDKYGFEFPGRPISIVEWEYEFAKENRKELKGYVKDPPGVEVDPRQAQFVARARAFREGSWIRKFAQAPQLIASVVQDLKKWIVDAGYLWMSRKNERIRWKDRMVLGACVGVAIATIGGIVAGMLLDIPSEKLLVVLAAGVTMFGALFWLLKSDVL